MSKRSHGNSSTHLSKDISHEHIKEGYSNRTYQSISELIYNISDNSYSLDNRFILVNRSYTGIALAPRCRLVSISTSSNTYSVVAHHKERQVSWVQNDVSQFGLYLYYSSLDSIT